MKTTHLFKMAGAWSPLWQLSDKASFEIKSLDYEANLCVLFPPDQGDILKAFKAQLDTVMDAIVNGHVAEHCCTSYKLEQTI